MQDLQDQFPDVCIPSYFSPTSNTHFLHIIFSIVQPPLSWLPNGPFSFWDILQHFLHTPSGILSTCPKSVILLFVIYEVSLL